jgi:hypothetical protein
MPVNRVPGGYRWGSRGKVYPTRAQAEAQGRAAYASGYGGTKRKAEGGKVSSGVRRLRQSRKV